MLRQLHFATLLSLCFPTTFSQHSCHSLRRMLTHARRAEGTPLWSGGPGPSPETSAKFDPLTRTVTADRSPDPTLAVPEAPAALRRLGLPAPNLITEPQAEGSRLGKQKAAVTVTVIADRLRASLLCACRIHQKHSRALTCACGAGSEAPQGSCAAPVALHQKHSMAAAFCLLHCIRSTTGPLPCAHLVGQLPFTCHAALAGLPRS